MATQAGREGSTAERHLAIELAAYLRGVADMRDTNTNASNTCRARHSNLRERGRQAVGRFV
jgi:hypothetical protein